MIAHTAGTRSHLAHMQHSSGTYLRLNCYVFFQKDQVCTCICTSTWVTLSDICVTTVNMRNEFYYKIPENIYCPQYTVILDSLYISGVGR
jgi:hypothetical protein